MGILPFCRVRPLTRGWSCRYGKVDSVRLRSVPVDLAKKMPRKAAVLSGAIAADRGTSHAYVVFSDVAAATAALAHNMQEVRGPPRLHGTACGPWAERMAARSIYFASVAFVTAGHWKDTHALCPARQRRDLQGIVLSTDGSGCRVTGSARVCGVELLAALGTDG